ncbi:MULTISPECIES: lactococcin family bacteriocin [Lactococcus]|jgi:hypothetical protein|uniref:Lactococcin family bacteriocin n=1 Tax=Lactococcus lactis TaxID=1358 RepID=A0A6B3S3K3_9LACT|nr:MULTISPECIES: lactococcin family bacteriocin [Lactococcus]MCA2382307.1 lactococcin family bacteriocin [Lactococcus sp. SK2-659]MCI2095352.1 lactococcin family bacteriocin [Lactococcus lactis]MCI2139187.1 lactococcin family bacteriocin [Lactococcus lactis]MCI2189388.1 lactococcin family bacteriocin [Lactococcus lactis]MCT1174394.1 hypothetical protein [Lactococcus lactis]
MKNPNNFEIISDEELSEITGRMTWWQGIDGVLSSFQSTPSWVQKKVASSGYVPYIPGGGSWVGGPGMKPGR